MQNKLQHSPTVNWASYQVIPVLHNCFANDTSLFSKFKDKSNSATLLNSDPEIISKWAFQWKMLFNPDISKQAIVICFSHTSKKQNYPPLTFNSENVQSAAN